MDLKILREYLDTLDTAIKYILVQRMSIIPLVAEYKIKNNLPVFQPKREEEMFEKMREFSEETGLNPELIPEIYKLITADSRRIQDEIKKVEQTAPSDKKIGSEEEALMQQSLENLKEFIGLMDKMKAFNLEKDNRIIEKFTCFYRDQAV